MDAQFKKGVLELCVLCQLFDDDDLGRDCGCVARSQAEVD